MSQLAIRTAPVRTAKRMQKMKEIKKIKAAVRWHERALKQRRALVADRAEAKASWQREQKFQARLRTSKRTALKNVREDYLLGPLRPNRAVGQDAPWYGALQVEDMQVPSNPLKVQKFKNEVRERRGLKPEYPLVVDDKMYYPIVENDRVVITKGVHKGRIGVVGDLRTEMGIYSIKGIPQMYADNRDFDVSSEDAAPKRLGMPTVGLNDMRLVIPYRITIKAADGTPRHTYQDVIVDDIIMERHTIGLDPFTGIDHGDKEFPANHRFDPETGLPLFNRYIAGTRRRIHWPWEKSDDSTGDVAVSTDADITEEKPSVLSTIRHPVKSLKRLLSKPKATTVATNAPENADEAESERIDALIETNNREASVPKPDKEKHTEWAENTGPHKAEPSDNNRSFYPTIVYPPHPNDLSVELASNIREKRWADSKDQNKSVVRDTIEKQKSEKEIAELERKKALMDSMKTPLQLRWELERVKRLEAEKVTQVDRGTLLAALGAHMQKSKAVKGRQAVSSGADKIVELD